MLSIIIPARQELYLQETVADLLKQASGEIEVIAILDGYWPTPILQDDPRLILVHRSRRGMRESINAGVDISRGEYIMKIDAHCRVSPGFDEVLTKECDGDWIVVPRRYALDDEKWDIRTHRPFVDYEYLNWPYSERLMKKTRYGMHAWVWDARIAERCNVLFDENMTFQGSCWLMRRDHWNRRIGRMDETGYGTFVGEAQELGLKTWLGGGRVMVNKRAWYAHLWKGQPYREKYRELYGRTYSRVSHHEAVSGSQYCIDYWLGNNWPGRIHDLEWLIERFWPVPSWPDDRGAWKLR